MSLSWVGAGTPVFYNRNSANEWVPATIPGPSQRPSDYLHIQYESNSKAVIHDAVVLGCCVGTPFKVTVTVDFAVNILW